MTAAQTAFHLLYDVILKFGKPEIIRFDKGPGFVGEMVAWITEAEKSLRRTSTPYHLQSMGLVERANQTIQASLSKMSFTRTNPLLELELQKFRILMTKVEFLKLDQKKKKISLYGSRMLILVWRKENNFFVDC